MFGIDRTDSRRVTDRTEGFSRDENYSYRLNTRMLKLYVCKNTHCGPIKEVGLREDIWMYHITLKMPPNP